MLLSNLIKKFLKEVGSERHVTDESNVICVDCAKILHSYDWMLSSIKTKENQIRDLISNTEIELSDKPIESIESQVHTSLNELTSSANPLPIDEVMIKTEIESLGNTEAPNSYCDEMKEIKTEEAYEIVEMSNPLAKTDEPNKKGTEPEQKFLNVQPKIRRIRLIPQIRIQSSANQLSNAPINVLNGVPKPINTNNLVYVKNIPIIRGILTKVEPIVIRPMSNIVSTNSMKQNQTTTIVPINYNSTKEIQVKPNASPIIKNYPCKCGKIFKNKKYLRVRTFPLEHHR